MNSNTFLRIKFDQTQLFSYKLNTIECQSVKLIGTNIFPEFNYISVQSYNLIKQTSIILLTSVNLNV